jgi:hypothetical protein
MPCSCLINSNIISSTPPITPGSLDVIYGTQDKTSNPYEGMYDYYYEYSYSVLFIDKSFLTGIPSGATIDSFNFEVYNTGNGTYEENALTCYMAKAPSSYTQLPTNLRLNLSSVTDTAWNADVTPVFIGSGINTTYIQTGADPNRNWYPTFDVPTSFTYTTGTSLVISLNRKSGTYTPGTSSYPRWTGQVLSGTQPRIWCQDNRVPSQGAFVDTQVVNYNSTFRPNIRINYS